MVDDGKIAFNPAVEISYLEQSEQRVLLNAMELNDCTPLTHRAYVLKTSQEGVLQDQTIYDILPSKKPNQQEQYKFKREDIRKYFPKAIRTSKSAIRSSSCWSNGSAGGTRQGQSLIRTENVCGARLSHNGKNGIGRVQ